MSGEEVVLKAVAKGRKMFEAAVTPSPINGRLEIRFPSNG